ncbi:MAG: hypothetical protein ACYC92_06260 [Candidatus Acidiferrales bacterium]
MVQELLMLSRITATPGSVASNTIRGHGARLVPAFYVALSADQCLQLQTLAAEATVLAIAASEVPPVAAAFTAAALGYEIEAALGGC